jgi:hypothetical protein
MASVASVAYCTISAGGDDNCVALLGHARAGTSHPSKYQTWIIPLLLPVLTSSPRPSTGLPFPTNSMRRLDARSGLKRFPLRVQSGESRSTSNLRVSPFCSAANHTSAADPCHATQHTTRHTTRPLLPVALRLCQPDNPRLHRRHELHLGAWRLQRVVVASIRAHSRCMYQHAHHPLRVVYLLHRCVAHWPSGHERMFIHARDAHRRLDLLSVVSVHLEL